MFNKLFKTDFHTMATLLSRSWSIMANALTIVMMALYMSPVHQGYYYTFASLIGLQMLFELGLGQVIIQLVSHDMAHLKQHQNHVLSGDSEILNHLASLMKLLNLWYIVAAVLFFVLAGLGGAYFIFDNNELPLHEWIIPWALIVLATAINLSFIPNLSFLEGCGKIGQVAKMRLHQSLIGSVLLWLLLYSNFELWAACVVPLTANVYTFFWLKKFNGTQHWLAKRKDIATGKTLNWFSDIFPFQWRIAASSLSGYFIFYAFTPIIFSKSGALEAGKFGIAMAIFNALGSVGSSWAHAKTPTMSMHIARHERSELNSIFIGVLKNSVLFTLSASFAIILFVELLIINKISYVERISEVQVLICLAVVGVANSVIFSVAAYMRAHREEPMLPVSLFGAVGAVLIAYYTAGQSIFMLSLLYAVLTTCALLPWSVFLFKKYYKR